jgi:hypothetical protein
MIIGNQGVGKVILPDDVLILSLASKETHYLACQAVFGYVAF